MQHLSILWVVLNRGYLHSFGVNCHLEGCHWKVIIVIHSLVLHGAYINFQLTSVKQPSWYGLQMCIWFMQQSWSVWRFQKNKLVKMPRAPEPRTISLLQAAAEWECGSGAKLNGGLWDCRGVVFWTHSCSEGPTAGPAPSPRHTSGQEHLKRLTLAGLLNGPLYTLWCFTGGETHRRIWERGGKGLGIKLEL